LTSPPMRKIAGVGDGAGIARAADGARHKARTSRNLQRQSDFQTPNGLRLSGARRTPLNDHVSPPAVCSGTATRGPCSRGLGSRRLRMGNLAPPEITHAA